MLGEGLENHRKEEKQKEGKKETKKETKKLKDTQLSLTLAYRNTKER